MAHSPTKYPYKLLPRDCRSRVLAVLTGSERPLSARDVAQAVLDRPPEPPEWMEFSSMLDSMSVHGSAAEIVSDVQRGTLVPRRFQGVQVAIVSVWLGECHGYMSVQAFMLAHAAGLIADREIENKLIEHIRTDGGWWSL